MSTAFTNHEQEILTPAETLQLKHSAMRVQFTWLGTKKALTDAQRAEVSDNYNAKSTMLSASKKLFDARHPAYRPLAKIKREITAYWRYHTLPFPEPGVRLMPQEKLEQFEEFMLDAKDRMHDAVNTLQEHYSELRAQAQRDLGRLFNEADYPTDLTTMFGVTWNVENISPPDYLLEVKPELYEREMQRIRGLFNNAVDLAEQTFIKELGDLVTNLTDRLSNNEDGTPKQFGDGCVSNLRGFIERFRDLSVRSNDDLEALVNQCDSLTRGVTAETFRNIPELREHVAGKLAEVQSVMERDMAIVPRRKIKRRQPNQEQG